MAGTNQFVAWLRILGRRTKRFWQGEYDVTTLRSVPSWGVSFLLHALLLLILALMIQFRHAPAQPQAVFDSSLFDTEIGDLTSVAPAKRSGDPFTLEQNLNPPSIGLEPEHSGVQLTGQPHLASLTQYAPTLAGPSSLPGTLKIGKASAAAIARLPNMATTVVAPFSGRSGLTRAKLVRREGGSAKSEQAVEDGLDWLVRHQREDGSWSLNFQDHCQGTPCPAAKCHQFRHRRDRAGSACRFWAPATFIRSRASTRRPFARGLEWLVEHQQPDGDLFMGPPGMAYMYSHAIAAMAICEGYGLSADPKLQVTGPAGQSSSSSILKTPSAAAGAIHPDRRAIPRSSAGRSSRFAAATWPASRSRKRS